ncbi:TPA: glucose-6-phosphate dehydrogenase [Candidatus Dependentiae bacterium]|nr:MAG: Glucose-6-phosphate 1-dehydrogenase [candidate division TM6 bacterium GW2011_GWE2_31_21]KKP54148.1 MAG: Glucose-6-phosphate 1-dehydrogenase [candidate division TM6 bacterium GW2011_GWF2_33_332]HBS47869.1 glucose-6-phosphate dehydrogenase [Candidatus Dependentiae bacterium]HBZ73054.1 glucose-6-phosphate dehydrogenase [Candidatus Dependentiae bacterium]
MNSCIFIILGATGDLTKRKLIPAIYNLIKNKKIDNFAIVGAALSQTTSEEILAQAEKFIKNIDKDCWNKLKSVFYYKSVNFYNEQEFSHLKELIEKVENKHKLPQNRLFYLATMPEHFEIITQNLSKCCIIKPKKNDSCKGWTRVVYEKPFGYDLESAKKINKTILKTFKKDQVFRIDHYLGKELVGNISLVRFTNRVFEPLWNNKNIDSIQIIINEKLGIENRGKFYDSCGAINDMMQSHMLQVLSLIAMETPKQLSGKFIHNAKIKVLKKIKPYSTILGQYLGYRSEDGVNPDSATETFAAIALHINNKRWKNVPFYLKTGKFLSNKESAIHIRFKMVKCLLSKCCPSDSNYLTIKIQPDAGFFLELNSKVPGTNEVIPVKMDFCHECLFGPNSFQAYEILLSDVMSGDQSFFLQEDEIEESWRIVQEIKKLSEKLYFYEKESSGPKEIEKLEPNKIVRWRS